MKNTNEKMQVSLGTSESGREVIFVAHSNEEKQMVSLFVSANENIERNIINNVGEARYIAVTKMILSKQGIDCKDMDYYTLRAIHVTAYLSDNTIDNIPKNIINDINRKDEGAMAMISLIADLIKLRDNAK